MKLINGTPFPDIFQKVDKSSKNYLFQGDVIKECGLISTNSNSHIGYLIVSNSCDLRRMDKKVAISVVPIYPFEYTLNKIIEIITKKVISQKKKYEEEGKDFDAKSNLESQVANKIFEEANYSRKYTFFISPLDGFNNLPSIALIEDISSINKKYKDTLLKHRIISLKNPWREKLGYMIGNLYNRVATYSPEASFIRDWWKEVYKKEYQEAVNRIVNPSQ